MSSSEVEVVHEGGCHCGAVKFRVRAPQCIKVIRCDCSICDMKQNHHFIVPESKFELVSGETELSTYRFNTKMAKHTFCSICGVQSFYTPRSNPDGRGIMPHCLVPGTIKSITYEHFNGQNWESEIEKMNHVRNMSKE